MKINLELGGPDDDSAAHALHQTLTDHGWTIREVEMDDTGIRFIADRPTLASQAAAVWSKGVPLADLDVTEDELSLPEAGSER